MFKINQGFVKRTTRPSLLILRPCHSERISELKRFRTAVAAEISPVRMLAPAIKGETTPLDTKSIIEELEAQRDSITRAIAALRGTRSSARPKGATAPTNGRKRHLSASARKRIGEAMKKKWAERKKKVA
jgi:hypothetical protein